VTEKKQACGYCPDDKCLLDCEICNPKKLKEIDPDEKSYFMGCEQDL